MVAALVAIADGRTVRMDQELRDQLQEAALPEDFATLWDWVHEAVTRMMMDEQAPRDLWALLMSKMPGDDAWSVFVENRSTLDLLSYWLVQTADTPSNALARLALAIHRGKPDA